MDPQRRKTLLRLAGMPAAARWLRAPTAVVIGATVASPSVWPREDAAAPRLLLARHAAPDVDPSAYLVSEKFDGVRALWDGTQLTTRGGRALKAPSHFLAALPTQALDGELWLGRGRFDALSAVVRSERPIDDAWRPVRYLAFELPGAPGSFAERARRLVELAPAAPGAAWRAVEQRSIADRAALRQALADVVAQGGEGLMLHRADAPYLTGRQDVLLKLKPQHDAEARVIGHREGRGKLAGLMGALAVETPQGHRFLLGTGFTEAQRRDPPALGSIVTYRYLALTPQGIPRFASFVRVHQDPP